MATYTHTFFKVNTLGYLMPANDPTQASPDNITHAQLRYSPFTSSQAIQGTGVTGATSSFDFTIAAAYEDDLLKMYMSTDGSTYTEDKTFGGATGRNLLNSLTGYANATSFTNGQIPVSNGSVWSGGLAPIGANFTNRQISVWNGTAWTGEVYPKKFFIYLQQENTGAPTQDGSNLNTQNTTGLTFTYSRLSTGYYRITASGSVPFNTTKCKVRLSSPGTASVAYIIQNGYAVSATVWEFSTGRVIEDVGNYTFSETDTWYNLLVEIEIYP